MDVKQSEEERKGVSEISAEQSTPSPLVVEHAAPAPLVTDGGLRAWLQVLGAFLMYFNLWGYTFAFGSFQNFYQSDFLSRNTASSIAWIGSVQSFLVILAGVFTGFLFDLGYFRSLMYLGAFISTLGSFMLSLSAVYWQVFLTQGVCVGLGCGILFIPSIALVSRSFTKRRALAVGLMSCGAPVGAIIYTLMFENLLPKLRFAWTARCLAFFMLGTYIIAFPLLLYRATNIGRIGSDMKRRFFDKGALKDLPWCFYSLSVSTQFLAYLIPFFYMPAFAQSQLGADLSYASYILVISQACSIPGRILAAVSANYCGVMVTWFVCAFVSGVLCFSWAAVKDIQGFIAFSGLYGCFSGALVPLPPSMFPRVVQDPRILGTRLGMAQIISCVCNFIGPPLAGALLQVRSQHDNNWFAVQLFSGCILILASAEILSLWVLLVKKRGQRVWI